MLSYNFFQFLPPLSYLLLTLKISFTDPSNSIAASSFSSVYGHFLNGCNYVSHFLFIIQMAQSLIYFHSQINYIKEKRCHLNSKINKQNTYTKQIQKVYEFLYFIKISFNKMVFLGNQIHMLFFVVGNIDEIHSLELLSAPLLHWA